MREVFLVCEGKHDEVDQRVLDLLVITAHSVPARINPAGGSTSLDSLRTFLEQDPVRGSSPSTTVSRTGFTIRDRDFSPLNVADQTWADPNRRNLMWRRHEIENYLVEPMIVHTWFENLRGNPPHGVSVSLLPSTLMDVEVLIEGFARNQIEHYVGQLVFTEMQQSHGRYTNEINIRRPQRSGAVTLNPNRSPTPSRSDWLNALNAEWRRIGRNRRAIGRIPDWSAHHIRQTYDFYRQQVDNATYFAQKKYLLDFEGKGIVWALQDYLRRTCRLPISTEKLESELIGVLPSAYATYNPYQPDEFLELAQRMLRASR